MFGMIKNFFNTQGQAKEFEGLADSWKEIVFYSESRSDWPHIGPIILDLLNKNHKVSVLSSDTNDGCFELNDPNLKSFYIGDGTTRTILFQTINCKKMVMTLPDLQSFVLKRSKNPVHYIYIFHSPVSSHMIYQEEAFDNYDTVFCVGKHHNTEIETREKKYNLKSKNLVNHGYAKLDNLIENRPDIQVKGKSVVIAPSWGPDTLLESGLVNKIIDPLLNDDYKVYLRVHPMTTKRLPQLIKKVDKEYSSKSNFILVTDMVEKASLYESSIMISEWSGAALDFAFSLERPVLFIDTPRKVNNQKWDDLGVTPFEDFIRKDIGQIVSCEKVSEEIVIKSNELIENLENYKSAITTARSQWMYNVGCSASVAAEEILKTTI